jgi:large subunit ribosomal protein L22
MRIVIDTVRSKPLSQALAILANMKKKGARLAEKTLKSAQANAKQKKMDEGRLFVSEIKADGGPTLKRFMSRSMGRADEILKRTTHLTVILNERERSRLQELESGKREGGKERLGLFKKKEKKRAVGGVSN